MSAFRCVVTGVIAGFALCAIGVGAAPEANNLDIKRNPTVRLSDVLEDYKGCSLHQYHNIAGQSQYAMECF